MLACVILDALLESRRWLIGLYTGYPLIHSHPLDQTVHALARFRGQTVKM